MDQLTPANQIRTKDLLSNLEAMVELLREIPPGEVKTVLDIRYGRGFWAQKVLERFPEAEYTGFESDDATITAAWSSPRVQLFNCFWPPEEVPGDLYPDLLLADFNVTTAKNRRMLDQVFDVVQPSRIIFTDVACVKLHLNYRSYRLDRPEMEEYWKGFRVPGYRLRRFSRKHHAASTALYEKTHRG
jgi:hypothetical protein